MNGLSRSNIGSALTRKANKILKKYALPAKVKCDSYTRGGTVTADQSYTLSLVRSIFLSEGIECSEIVHYASLGDRFYIQE